MPNCPIICTNPTRRGVFGMLAAMSAAAALGGCNMLQSETIRYRMTVEVETPQGLRSGSSVIETSVRPSGRASAVAVNYSYRGEAVAVDLPSGQTLFALLQSANGDLDAATQFPIWAMADRIPRPGEFKEKLHWLAQYAALRKLDGVGILPRTLPVGYYPPVDKPPSAYPLLVHFRDIRDPKTVVRIDPTEVAASFGPGVKLRRITVQITDDAVTMGIKKRLRWLDKFYDKMLDGSPINNSQVLANNLSQMDFSAGASK